jgi:hypothetical protein
MAAGSITTIEEFVSRDHGLAVVSVRRPDGEITSSVVNAGVVEHPTNSERVIGFVVAGSAKKLAHLRAAGRCTLVWRAGWAWIGATGPAEIAGPDDLLPGLSDADLPALLRAVFTGAGGTHDDWEEFDRVMAAERRAAVLVRPARIYGVPS